MKEALQALRSNLMRSSLTVIGVVVGIFSVTAMLAVGEGLSQNILGKFNSFISGDISIQGDILVDDYSWIKDQGYTKNAAASVSLSRTNVLIGQEEYKPNVSSVLGDFTEMNDFKLLSGNLYDFNNLDYSEKVVLLDKKFTDSLDDDGLEIKVDDSLRIKGIDFKVIGITDIVLVLVEVTELFMSPMEQ